MTNKSTDFSKVPWVKFPFLSAISEIYVHKRYSKQSYSVIIPDFKIFSTPVNPHFICCLLAAPTLPVL